MEGKNNNLHLYSVSQAAKLLGIGRDTLKNLITQGKIGVIKTFKRNKISHLELERFIRDNSIREKSMPEINFTDRDIQSFINGSAKKTTARDSVFDKLIKEFN